MPRRKVHAEDAVLRIICIAVVGIVGCATGSAQLVFANKDGGVVKYVPGKNAMFGKKGVDKARDEARKIIAGRCGKRGFDISEEGEATLTIQDTRASAAGGAVGLEAGGGRAKDQSESVVTRRRGERELRMTYVCGGAPDGYLPPPLEYGSLK